MQCSVADKRGRGFEREGESTDAAAAQLVADGPREVAPGHVAPVPVGWQVTVLKRIGDVGVGSRAGRCVKQRGWRRGHEEESRVGRIGVHIHKGEVSGMSLRVGGGRGQGRVGQTGTRAARKALGRDEAMKPVECVCQLNGFAWSGGKWEEWGRRGVTRTKRRSINAHATTHSASSRARI